ncbi:MAG: glycosyltransferase family 2 protein [Smithella sp.]|nr:glycosyltransferase family 2 protein [Smithella sp.]
MEKISIITVCRNSETTIRETLESVASQSYKNIEHIVVDGGSVDGTLTVLREWKKYSVRLVSEPDEGIYDAMNKGIGMATGDIIGIINSDDIYSDAGVLEKVISVMQDNAVDACYADLIYVDKNKSDRIIRYWKSCAFEKGLFADGWMPPHPTFFTRRSVYDKYGLFDLKYSLAADFELMARLMEKYKIKSVYIPEIFIKMRYGGVSNRSMLNIVKQNIQIYQACRENNLPVSLSKFLLNKLLSRTRQYYSKPEI